MLNTKARMLQPPLFKDLHMTQYLVIFLNGMMTVITKTFHILTQLLNVCDLHNLKTTFRNSPRNGYKHFAPEAEALSKEPLEQAARSSNDGVCKLTYIDTAHVPYSMCKQLQIHRHRGTSHKHYL